MAIEDRAKASHHVNANHTGTSGHGIGAQQGLSCCHDPSTAKASQGAVLGALRDRSENGFRASAVAAGDGPKAFRKATSGAHPCPCHRSRRQCLGYSRDFLANDLLLHMGSLVIDVPLRIPCDLASLLLRETHLNAVVR